ncbi:MAG: HAMP domain-containing histidine kinase [Saprospiraceae bacterium]|nr:HAMP domain-containing histidine kinase [Saprospiraceae bacterium]MBK7700427.1 HAMP domain-containing histidine kinase [Saprospiraceae bacterium]
MSTSIHKSNYWKIILMVMGAALLLFTVMYSNFLADSLKKNEEKNIFLFKQALERFINQDVTSGGNNDIALHSTIVDSFPLPVVFEDETGNLQGQNFSEEELNDPEFLKRKKEEFLESGEIPIKGYGYSKYIYCFNSPLLGYIKLFPLVQGLMVSLYIALGYFLFSSSRKAEQNRVWAGMAKETAHQLGTPISAILGWIEYLKDSYTDKPEGLDVLEELKKDVDRLELVADRFSKIGSDPVLEDTNIYDELEEVKDYLQRRSPRKVSFVFEKPEYEVRAMVNKHLFVWVIENLVRNSLDAMDGKGTIGCKMYRQNTNVVIEMSDTGHGIAASKFKSVFKPGYSTKKRGWGLGLSLAKRIIEDYHKGKIYVKSSKPNEETIFAIVLPITG